MPRMIRCAAAIVGGALLMACLACGGERPGPAEKTGGEGVREMKGSIRYPAVAGQFYPGSPDALKKEVRGFLDAAPRKKIEGRIVGLVSPHAGYTYSGATAAYGYSLLKGSGITRVVVLAPTHRVGFKGAAVTDAGFYRTPLGDAIRGHYLRWAIYGFVIGLIPGFRVDNAAHLGGLAAGFAGAYLMGTPSLVENWREWLWKVTAIGSVALTVLAFAEMYLWFARG